MVEERMAADRVERSRGENVSRRIELLWKVVNQSRGRIVMKSVVHLFLVLFVLVLAAPGLALSSNEQPSAGGGTAEAAKSAEPAAPEAKGVEAPPTFGPILSDTAVPIEKGKFAIQPTFVYGVVTDTFDRNWARRSAGGDFQSFSMNWRFTYGPVENMEIFAVIPYVYNWARNVTEPGLAGDRSASSGDLGDINFTVKYRLVRETETLPTVTALLSTGFPTGRFRGLNSGKLGTDVTGTGSYVFTPGINVSKYVKPFVLYGNFWYSMPTSRDADDGRRIPGDFFTVNFAAEYPMTEKWVALLELTSHWGCGPIFGPAANVPQSSLFSVAPGIEYMATDKFSLALGLNVDLVGKNTNATVAPLLSMIYLF